MKASETRVLVMQLRQLGDILLTTPVLRALKQAKERFHVTFLSHAMGRLVIDECPYVDEYFTYKDSDSLAEQWRLLKSLRSRPCDVVLDFMGNPRSALYTVATGATQRVCFASRRAFLYSDVVSKPAEPTYIVREKFLLLQSLGIEPDDESLVLPWTQYHTKPFFQMLAEHAAFKEAPVRVALSPTHRRAMRQWPLARYAALADWLTREWGAAVVWIWGPGEEELIDQVRGLCRESTWKAPPTSFRELAALLANVDLFVGNSNGPSHVATAVGIASLQLHGHTYAASWCPESATVQSLQSATQLSSPNTAMEAISLEQVTDKLNGMRTAVEGIIEKRRAIGARLHWR